MELKFKEGSAKYTKKEILKNLYAKKMDMYVHIDKGEFIEIASVDFISIDGTPDCLIGNFYNNWYVRTSKGTQHRQYTSMGGLLGAIDSEINKLNYSIYKIVITKYGTKEKICEFI